MDVDRLGQGRLGFEGLLIRQQPAQNPIPKTSKAPVVFPLPLALLGQGPGRRAGIQVQGLAGGGNHTAPEPALRIDLLS